MIDSITIAAIAAVFVFGGMVKGALGFGLPLVTIAVLPFLVPVEVALALNSVVLVGVNAVQAAQFWQGAVILRLAAPVAAGIAVATPLATVAAVGLPRPVVVAALGVFITVFALRGLLPSRRTAVTETRRPAPWRGVLAGLAGGVVGALTSAPGPVFVMHYTALRLERAAFMAVLGLVMGGVGIFLAASLAVAGVLTAERFVLSLGILPAAFLGFWLGGQIGRRFSIEGFRRAVLCLLLCLGAAMIWRSLS